MNITLALKTLKAFEDEVARDQGGRFRQFEAKVLPHLGDAYRAEEEGFRSHLGASFIGRECERMLWYNFRWVSKVKFSGRMQRLFNRGHLEEGRMIALLLTIGAEVYQQDENGKQFRISYFGGHYGGSGDGVVLNIPDVPAGMPVVGEYKTHNDKSFKKLAGTNWDDFHESIINGKMDVHFTGVGVKEAKPEHWVQMQAYMRKMGIATALYLAVNKNDDHIYAELVYLDSAVADSYVERASRVIPIHVPPPMINKSLGWYGCKFCDYKPVCKQGYEPARNCRTCQFSEPNMETGTWTCENKDRQMQMLFGPKPGVSEPGETFTLTKERQLTGCDLYLKLNAL